MAKWAITIPNLLGGFAPAWWKGDYPAFGNINQAGDMLNVDLTNPSYITQGKGLTDLTNGNQLGAVTTLIKGLLDMAVSSDTTYGVGGAKLYKLSSTTVTSDVTWPHTIDHPTATGEDGEDVAYYQGKLYYSYNHSAGGDIGQFDLSATFDDDWGSTVPTGAGSLTNNPHQMVVGGNDFLYIANGNKVASYDGNTGTGGTLTLVDLDLPDNSVISSIAWTSNRLWVASNRPNLSGSNKNIASLYVWDGNSPSWEDEIRIMGRIGALYVKNGILFVFYEDITSTGGYKLGYVSGISIKDVANFKGSLPLYYQVTDYEDFLIWNSDGLIYAWGTNHPDIPVRLFQLADGGYATVGCISASFGTPLVASTDGINYRLAKFSGYDTNCNWKSLLFNVTEDGRKSIISKIKFNFEVLATGARVDWTLKDNKGTSLKTGTISFASDGAITTKDFYPKINAENFRIELDWASGSTTNPVSIRNIRIEGNTIK